LQFIEKGYAPESQHRIQSLWDDIYAAIESIQEISRDLSETGLLFWAINPIVLHASKSAMLLTKVGDPFLAATKD